MVLRKLLDVMVCVILLGHTSFVSAASKDSQLSTSEVFQKVALSELTELVKVTKMEEWNGRDRLIRATGVFSPDDEKRVIELLYSKEFEDSDDVTFISGDDDLWWGLKDSNLVARSFVKSVPGQDTFIKLVSVNSGEKRFLLEQTDF